MQNRHLHTFIVDPDKLVNAADDPFKYEQLRVKVWLEISEGSDYYGTTSQVATVGLIYPVWELVAKG